MIEDDIANLERRIDALEAQFFRWVKEWYGIDLASMSVSQREALVRNFTQRQLGGTK